MEITVLGTASIGGSLVLARRRGLLKNPLNRGEPVEEAVDVFLVDATFWWDNELERISGIPVTSYQLGHVPQEEAVEILKDADIGRVIYTHFNHTNPAVDPTSVQRKIVENMGQEIAHDGMKISL